MRRTGPIKVLIVDDSAAVRTMLARVLSQDDDIEVVPGAKDPFEGRERIIEHRPDVIILDIEMPRMDGLTFLKKLKVHYPVPVIMCSGAVSGDRSAAMTALELGAIDVIAKPSTGGNQALRRLGEELAEKIRAAAASIPRTPPVQLAPTPPPASFRAAGIDPSRYLVAIGASTGGTEAIKRVLQNVPADFPPVAMVQHMPAAFTRPFAERLNSFSRLTVKEAVHGEYLVSGKAVLARGEIQMRLRLIGNRWRVVYGEEQPVNRHCPSVDVLFDSLTGAPAGRTIGVILTGMGADGARGLLRMRQAGAVTVAQNHESSVVYGMPKVALELGAVQHVASPTDVPRIVLHALRQASSVTA